MRSILLQACILFFPIIGFAQNNTGNTILQQEITYDVQKGAFDHLPDYVKEKSAILLKYINVNPSAVESAPTFTNINTTFNDGLSEVQNGLTILAGAKSTSETNLERMAKGTGLMPNNKTPSYISKKDDLLTLINSSFLSIRHSIMEVKGIMGMDVLVKNAQGNPQIYNKTQMQKAIFDPMVVYSITKPEDIVPGIKTRIDGIFSNTSSISANLEGLRQLVRVEGTNISAEEKKSMQTLIDSISKQVTHVNDTYIDDNTILTNAMQLQVASNGLLEQSFTLLPKKIAVAKGDLIQISDELKDKTGKVLVQFDGLEMKTYKGSRVDVSVGIALNVFGNGTEYNLRKNPDNVTTGTDTAKIILNSTRSNKILQFNPVINVHWYLTTTRVVQEMLTIGLSPDFSTLANSRLFVGGSLGFPSSNDLTRRIVLSLGLSVGYADVLKSKYKDWSNYNRFTDVEDTDLTTKALRAGCFFSVSYNLGGIGHSTK